MIFESFWPLFLLAAVPVIIILYLLKPKGTDYRISSNLLWQKLLKNQQSKTFLEKFVHNILMYVQILIVGLLMVALMSPFIRVDGKGGGRRVLLMDVSGSMQHVGASGKSRLEEAVDAAIDYVRNADDTRFSVVAADGGSTELLAVDLSDAEDVAAILRGLTASDRGGSLTAAQSILDTLAGSEEDQAAELMVYTDGAGAADFEELTGFAQKELYVAGEPVSNVANEYTVFAARDDGTYDIMVSLRCYSDQAATFDVGLYDADEKLIGLKSMSLGADESAVCLFEQVDWQGQVLSARVSGVVFDGTGVAGTSKDSLEADNISWAVKGSGNQINGLLVGAGNTFLEKAYRAVTGSDLTKAANDAAVGVGAYGQNDYNVVIYDNGQEVRAEGGNKLIFGDPREESEEVLENVVVHMKPCDLTAGLADFTVGVNQVYSFALPEGAESFLEYEGKCIGYYGERDGRKEVVIGFDIRESDFPLRAEFPVLLADVLVYLSDTSWLDSTVYYAGDEIRLRPWADAVLMEGRPRKAGLYHIGNEEYEEFYVVRFQTMRESDGRQAAEAVAGSQAARMQKVKRTLRNLFVIAALLLLIAEWILYVRQMRYKGKFYLAVRGVVMVCLLLALFGIQLRIGKSQTATVFVVDLSNSNAEHIGEMENYLQAQVERMPAGNVYGVVTFGKDALVEQFMTNRKAYGGLMTLPEKTATDFEEAVSRALTLIPGDAAGRVVVLTDGRQTRGDIRNMAKALTAGGTEFLTLLYEDEEKDDAYIENVVLPAYLHPGDKYSITVLAESNYDTDAVIAVYHGSTETDAYSVHLNKGSNRFVFNGLVDEEMTGGSMESLRVQVRAPGDSCEENDFYAAYSVVETTPRILLVSGKGVNVSALTTVLQAAGCDYSVVSAYNAPETIDGMLAYKSILLADAYIDDLPKGFLDNLESYVKDYGCGFVCCGGQNSFALGGYRDTVLETVLPVDMRLKTVNELQTMAMVMVIDRSGSMCGGTGPVDNLDVAIQAATVAVDNLQDTDYVGVLTFDDQYDWQVELTQADDRAAIKEKIKEIDAGGGTTIKPALAEAYDVISQSTASKKHVVLLTDGMGETTNFDDVVKEYQNGGVTLSTVAVGSGSDTKLLERLAKKCGGRYYYSDLSTDIPKIFAQEVFLGGDSYLQDGQFTLAVSRGNELTNNLFPEGWPILYGYISATPKTASNPVIKAVEKDAPILTVWQYGLGRTAAWNSDITGEWTAGFSGRDDYVQLWKRIVDYSTGNADLGEDHVDVETAGEVTKVVYRTLDYSAGTQVMATVVDPEGAGSEVKLHATAPGTYETELPTAQTGMYHLNVRRVEDGEIQSYLTTAAAVQFSDEYKFDVSPEAYVSFAGAYGRMIEEKDDIWTGIRAKTAERRSLTNLLLFLALLIFLADVAMRRLQYEPKFNRIAGIRRNRQQSGQLQAAETWNGGQQPDAMSGETGMQTGGGTAGAEPSGSESPAGNGTAEAGRQPKRAKAEKRKKQQEQTLDTLMLLKKKDDRNI